MKHKPRKILLICVPLLLLALAAVVALAGTASPKTIYAVSNSHLDTVWSWDLEETIEKFIPDTLHGNFGLIEKYPAYQFNFEGAYRYQLMAEYYPEEFERLKGYVASGNWNPIGSGLENGDVNSPSPEALLRNFLYGNNYFENTFGRRSSDIFLPDCFGFGYALPSVAHHANLIGFTTQKLSWGNTFPNAELPFDIGLWVGPDGNGILANINGNDYGSSFDSGITENKGMLQKLAKSPVGRSVVLYGSGGDRGGPPSEQTVAAISREVEENKFSLPVYFGKGRGLGGSLFPAVTSLRNLKVAFAPPEQVFKDILAAGEQEKLPGYDGELLLYQHATGGYTSRAISKRWNRRGELLADAAERSLTAASWLGASAYPKAEMEKIWTNLISHQFHDDIPGASNSTTYQRSWNDYMVDIKQFAAEYENGVAGVAALMDTRAEGIPLVVNNPVAANRTATVEATLQIPSRPEFVRVFDNEGNETAAQIISKNGAEYHIRFVAAVKSMGYRAYSVRPSGDSAAPALGLRLEEHKDGYILENEKYEVIIDANGDIASIVDKSLQGKELLNQPIRLGQFDNSPIFWSSWELNFDDYWDKEPARYVAGEPKFSIEEAGRARVALRIEREYGKSKYTQVVSLDAGGEIVRIDNVVDWNERAVLLKAVFDLASENEMAAYDLGLGVIERGSNNGGGETEHKKAEVPHQKWADLTAADGGFGVSILNDCKTGIDKPNGSTLRLTLIHTPANDFTHDYVDIPAGQDVQELGENRFSFAVYSHGGAWSASGVQLEAEAFNQPMNAFQTAAHDGPLGGHYSFGSLNTGKVLVRAVKMAERGDEIVVRFNEGAGEDQADVRFTLGEGIESAREIYASEEEIGPAQVENGSLVFDIGKYGVKSFALRLKAPGVSARGKDTKAVDLRPYYNVDAYSGNGGRADGGLTILGDCYPSELVPESILFAGVSYQTGDKTDGALNAVRAAGQTIPLPEGYPSLKLLAASVRGDKRADFQAGGKTVTLEIADFAENVAAWDLPDLGQDGYVKQHMPAFKATHRHSAGKDNTAATTYLFLYTLELGGAASVTLPDDEDIIIFAATVVNEDGNALACVSPLHDERARRGEPAAALPEDDRQYEDSFTYSYEPAPAMNHKTSTVFGCKAKIVKKDGGDAVKISGLDWSSSTSYAYVNLYTLDEAQRVKIQPGTTLSYEFRAENKLGRYVAVDLEFEDGNLRDSGSKDQNGVRVHPSDAKTEKTGEWITVTCELSEKCLGQVITDIRVAYDHPPEKGGFTAYVRNISIRTVEVEEQTTLERARELADDDWPARQKELLAAEIARCEADESYLAEQRLARFLEALRLAQELEENPDDSAQNDIALFEEVWASEGATERERDFALRNLRRRS